MLADLPLAEAIRRARLYVEAGADVIRIAIDNPKDVEALVEIRAHTKANLAIDLQAAHEDSGLGDLGGRGRGHQGPAISGVRQAKCWPASTAPGGVMRASVSSSAAKVGDNLTLVFS